LNYQLAVIKDQYPSIDVLQAPDSLKVDKSFLLVKLLMIMVFLNFKLSTMKKENLLLLNVEH